MLAVTQAAPLHNDIITAGPDTEPRKAEPNMRTVHEVSELTGISVRTLHPGINVQHIWDHCQYETLKTMTCDRGILVIK